MGKLIEATEDIVKIVKEISNELGLSAYNIDVQPICAEKLSEVCKVVRANQLAEYVSARDNLIFVMCNEEVFNGTDPMGHPLADEKTKYMWIRNAMEVISYDSEKDKVILSCPMISVPLGFYEKFKEPTIDAARLGLYTMAQITKMKKKEAERKKAEKKDKKKNKTK